MMQPEILMNFAEQYSFEIKEYGNAESYLEDARSVGRLKPNTLGLLLEETGSRIEGIAVSLGDWNGNELWETLAVNNITPQYIAAATDTADINPGINASREALTVLILHGTHLRRLPENIGDLHCLSVLEIKAPCLEILPDSICQLAGLEYLILEETQVSALPNGIGNLSRLYAVKVRNSRLTKLPESIKELVCLQYLCLEYNQLECLPSEIGSLTDLKRLDVRHNYQLCVLPESLGNLIHLEELCLDMTGITRLPDSICRLVNLQDIYISNTPISSLPENIGDLVNLKIMYLPCTQLEYLPESIVTLHSLEHLSLCNTPVRTLPEHFGNLSNLIRLDIGLTEITELPVDIGNLKNLEELDISDSPVKSLPEGMYQMSKLRDARMENTDIPLIERECFSSFLQKRQMYKNEPLIEGPYTSDQRPKLMAYFISDFFEGHMGRVCIVTQRDAHIAEIIAKNSKALFEYVYADSYQTFSDWDKVGCYCFFLNFSDPEYHEAMGVITRGPQINNGLEEAAQKIIEEAVEHESVENGNRRYEVYKYHKAGGIAADIYEKDSAIRHKILKVNDETDLNIFFSTFESHIEFECEMYLEEIQYYYEKKEYLNAFQSYFRYVDLTVDVLHKQVGNDMLETGIKLTQLLYSLPDYAEYMARWIAEYAVSHEQLEYAGRSWRLAAIANELLGRAKDMIFCYDKAFQFLDASKREAVIQIMIDYGISVIEQTLFLDTYAKEKPEVKARYFKALSDAGNFLEKAQAMLEEKGYDDQKKGRRLLIIQLYKTRLSYLDGDFETAYDVLTEIYGKCFSANSMLFALILIMAALKELCAKNKEYEGELRNLVYYLRENELFLDEQIEWPNYYFFYLSEIGDVFNAEGRYDDALSMYERAMKFQMKRYQNNIRPLDAIERAENIYSVDIAGMIQETYIRKEQLQQSGAEVFWIMLTTAERIKTRFFVRDLLFNMEGGVQSKDTDIRILKLEHEKRKKEEGFEELYHSLSPEKIKGSMRAFGKRTALVSFYAAENVTFLYLYLEYEEKCGICCLNVSLSWLERMTDRIYTGIHGNMIYPPISQDNPGNRDAKYFAPFLELEEQFEPVAEFVKDAELIIVIPHNVWSVLPINALLLPHIWNKGSRPGIIYAPGIDMLETIRQREGFIKRPEYRKMLLVTVPKKEDKQGYPCFAEAHKNYKKILREEDMQVCDYFGGRADKHIFLKEVKQCGLLHILCHGMSSVSANALNSAILLSNHGLPSDGDNKEFLINGYEIMQNGISCRHVTLQACSLGRGRMGYDNEYWGFSRALLSAGADSVLASLWDISLESSSHFMKVFYENWITKKQSKYAAWANAQYEMYANGPKEEWKHFYHWAPFILLGC